METVSIVQLQHALRLRRVAVVDFTSANCAPCRTVMPVIQQLAQRVPVLVVNIDDNAEYITSKYGIRSVPTVVLYQNGMEAARLEGVFTLAQALQRFDRFF